MVGGILAWSRDSSHSQVQLFVPFAPGGTSPCFISSVMFLSPAASRARYWAARPSTQRRQGYSPMWVPREGPATPTQQALKDPRGLRFRKSQSPPQAQPFSACSSGGERCRALGRRAGAATSMPRESLQQPEQYRCGGLAKYGQPCEEHGGFPGAELLPFAVTLLTVVIVGKSGHCFK